MYVLLRGIIAFIHFYLNAAYKHIRVLFVVVLHCLPWMCIRHLASFVCLVHVSVKRSIRRPSVAFWKPKGCLSKLFCSETSTRSVYKSSLKTCLAISCQLYRFLLMLDINFYLVVFQNHFYQISSLSV